MNFIFIVLMAAAAEKALPPQEYDKQMFQEMDRHSASFQECYKKAKSSDGDNKLVIEFTIQPTGKVSKTNIKENNTGSDTVAPCIEDLFKQLTFPPPGKKAVIKRMPLHYGTK